MSVRSRIFVFEFLLVIIVLSITSAGSNLEKSTTYSYGEISMEEEQQIMKCQVGNSCEAFCVEQNKSSAVEGDFFNDTRCSLIGYHFNFVFSNTTTLRPGWFSNNALIRKITIRGGSIVDIDPGAFDSCVFRSVHSLELRGTGIVFVRKGALTGLHSLKTLALYGNSDLEGIEEKAMEGLYQLEEFVMEEQMKMSDLVNVTGSIEWKYLQTLSLSKNCFGSLINRSTFKGCTQVQKLNLSNSEIEAVGPYSFEPMKDTIAILDLSNNRLKSLPSDLFEPIIQNVQLHLSNNLWNCGCDSFALQLFEIYNPGMIVDSPLICETPETERGYLMRDVEIFCHDTTTESPAFESTTHVWYPPNLDHLICLDYDPYPGVLSVETEFQYFNVKQEGDGKISIEINYPDSSLAMVYINDHDYKARCLYNLKRRMEFDSLNTKAGHLFCLIKKTAYTTSPRNCLPFHFTQTTFTWSRDRIVIALICSFVLVTFIAIIICWRLVCRYRRVAKSKGETVIRHGLGDSKTKAINDDFYSWSDFQHKKYFMDANGFGASLRRSYSDNSLASHKTYLTPSPIFDVMQPRTRNNKRISNEYTMRGYTDRLPYDVLPPPLPPQNDRRERIYETIMDPPFTCDGQVVPYAYVQRKY